MDANRARKKRKQECEQGFRQQIALSATQSVRRQTGKAGVDTIRGGSRKIRGMGPRFSGK